MLLIDKISACCSLRSIHGSEVAALGDSRFHAENKVNREILLLTAVVRGGQVLQNLTFPQN